MGRGGAPATQLQVVTLELSDTEHAPYDQDDDEEQHQIGEQAVYAEHDEDGGIVAGEVAQVVVDTALDLTKVGWLRDALDVEELGDGAQIGESRGHGGVAQAVEASTEVQARRQGVDGDAETRHDGCRCGRIQSGLRSWIR